MKRTILYLLTTFIATIAVAQYDLPKGYFTFPIKPDQQNFLSGSMGELRSNHFHAGIDIKTFGEQGWPIHASAEGYVSRIKISPYGYGRVIYVQHPNGYTTTYAHCSLFKKDLEQYTIDQQYKKEQFSIDISLTPNQFPVKQGQVIAYSGNTGGSQGPHLHFEIRDEWQAALNPLLFDFDEIIDKTKPSVYSVELIPLTKDSRVNNRFEKKTFKPVDGGGRNYQIKQTISGSGFLGLAVKTNDKLDGANNRNGIAQIMIFQDGQKIFEYHNTRVSFAETRFINQHIDFQAYKNGKGRYHKCFIDDGNKLPLYKDVRSNGSLIIDSNSLHKIEVRIWDAYNNLSTVNLNVQHKKPERGSGIVSEKEKKIEWTQHKNTLKITCNNCSEEDQLDLAGPGFQKSIPASYFQGTKAIFLHDLKKFLPHTMTIADSTYFTHYKVQVPSQQPFNYFGENVQLNFGSRTIYDTLFLFYTYKNDTLDMNNVTVPIHKNLSVTLRPKYRYDKSKARVYSLFGKRKYYVGGSWIGDQIQFNTRELGRYTILEDYVAPTITYLGGSGDSYRFKINDKDSGIKSYRATLDGKWILLQYDYKARTITTRSQNRQPIQGRLNIIVTDQVGNIKSFARQL